LIETKLTKLPEIEAEWGSLSTESKAVLLDWTKKNLDTFICNLRNFAYTKKEYDHAIESFAEDLIYELYNIGWHVGYQNAELDNDEEGL
jgi:hypothetical protein